MNKLTDSYCDILVKIRNNSQILTVVSIIALCILLRWALQEVNLAEEIDMSTSLLLGATFLLFPDLNTYYYKFTYL